MFLSACLLVCLFVCLFWGETGRERGSEGSQDYMCVGMRVCVCACVDERIG